MSMYQDTEMGYNSGYIPAAGDSSASRRAQLAKSQASPGAEETLQEQERGTVSNTPFSEGVELLRRHSGLATGTHTAGNSLMPDTEQHSRDRTSLAAESFAQWECQCYSSGCAEILWEPQKTSRKINQTHTCVSSAAARIRSACNKFYTDDEGRCIARFQPKPQYQGYPGQLHGGIIWSLLDERTHIPLHVIAFSL